MKRGYLLFGVLLSIVFVFSKKYKYNYIYTLLINFSCKWVLIIFLRYIMQWKKIRKNERIFFTKAQEQYDGMYKYRVMPYVSKNHKKVVRLSSLAKLKDKNTKVKIDKLHNDGMYKYRGTLYVSI